MRGRKQGVSIRSASLVMAAIAIVISFLLIRVTHHVISGYAQLRADTDQYIQWQQDASELQAGSDYLTEQVRCFAATGEREYLDAYFEEANVTQQRENAVQRIYDYMGETPAYQALVSAMGGIRGADGSGILFHAAEDRGVRL